MLDLDHPMTPHRFAAARAGDRISILAKLMTLASSEERRRLQQACYAPLTEVRQLNADYFGASDFIVEAVTELERTLDDLASMETNPHDGTAYAIATCPACAALLTRHHAPYMPQPELR